MRKRSSREGTPRITPQEFVAKWRQSSLKETSASQEHFIDLCRLIGHPTPAQADPEGTWFCFERGASKISGGEGWADVWKKGFFAWEYKGKKNDLEAAYRQLLQYRTALLNPPLLIVSDMETILIRTDFTNTVRREFRLSLDDLLEPAGLQTLRAAFESPDRLRAEETSEEVTREVATQFSKLADALRSRGVDPHAAAHFLIRVLFCLFAEDVGLLPNELFRKLVENARDDPASFEVQVGQLFAAMRTGGWFGIDRIPNVNGGLFDESPALRLEKPDLEILARATQLDWSAIEPSIFGTLFERSLDPGKRAQLGAHYTSREDILLIVEPVLMAPLRRRWQEVKEKALALSEKHGSAKSGQVHTRLRRDLSNLLTGFADEIAMTTVLDPACGSGNFLYVALRELLNLEKEVITLSADLGVGAFFPSASPSQLFGIEINEYAHELAQATIWIGYIQWLRENGFGYPKEPILRRLDNIHEMDAILAIDEAGKPAEPEWPEATVVVSNPPFLGSQKLRSELGDEYVEHLFTLYKNRVPGAADLCCYWFEKARAMIESGKLKRAGLLATQGIRGGANRTVLERVKQTGDIFWAQSDRDWILEGAAVHVSMVGFDGGSEAVMELDGQHVPEINASLATAADIDRARVIVENEDLCFQGPVKVGPFEVTAEVARSLLSAPNPSARPNGDVVRPWITAWDITHRNRGLWIIDFGDCPLEEACEYETPFEYVKTHVKPLRDENRRRRRRQLWWQHGEAVPGLRRALATKARYIGTPRISKHRVFVWVGGNALPDSGVVAFARDDDYFFGVLHSKVHELWALEQGTQLEDRPRYTPTTCFETFPFPWPPGEEPANDPRVQAIAAAAKDLVEKRDRWLNPEGATEAELKKRTLTNLYNERPTWLDLAHKKLDQAVLDAYAWPRDLPDDQILERLLALNLERTRRSMGGS
jgi:type II restriction/modification system DNA methylase subunit YeeA